MSFTRWSPLLGTLVRLDDSGTGPPWPLEVYNPGTHNWETVGIVGAQGPAGPSYAPLLGKQVAPAGGQASFDFPDIPQSFNTLRLVLLGGVNIALGGGASYAYVALNGDTDVANYGYVELWSNGPIDGYHATNIAGDSQFTGDVAYLASMTTTDDPHPAHPTVVVCDIPGYAQSVWQKVGIVGASTFGQGEWSLENLHWHWLNSAPITRLTVAVTAGAFAEGTTALLYAS